LVLEDRPSYLFSWSSIILSQPGFQVKPATTHQEIRSAQLQASSGHHHYNWFSRSRPGEICCCNQHGRLCCYVCPSWACFPKGGLFM